MKSAISIDLDNRTYYNDDQTFNLNYILLTHFEHRLITNIYKYTLKYNFYLIQI